MNKRLNFDNEPDQGQQPRRFSQPVGRLISPNSPFNLTTCKNVVVADAEILVPQTTGGVVAQKLDAQHILAMYSPEADKKTLTIVDAARGTGVILERQGLHPIIGYIVSDPFGKVYPAHFAERFLAQQFDVLDSALSILPERR